METKDRMTLEFSHSMLYVRVDFLTYLGYSEEEAKTDPLKVVVEAQVLPDGRKVLVIMKPEKEPVQEEVKM